MFLLIRDEDVPTVAEAIRAYAIEEGLEVEPESAPDNAANPLAVLAALAQPRVFVAMSEDGVVVTGLDSLDLADADEWAAKLSSTCSTEVVAIAVADDGVRVYVFDDGELESEIEVPLDPSGQASSAELAELLDDAGPLPASSPDDLAQAILDRLGAAGPMIETTALAFRDPIDHAPMLRVEPPPGVVLTGNVDAPIVSAFGYTFALSLEGVDAIDGCLLELGGDAPTLLTIEGIDVLQDGTARSLEMTGPLQAILDVRLERVDVEPPALDMTDMFSSVQRLMSATETRQRNTVILGVRATGRAAGEGELVLTASPLSGDVAAGSGTMAVRVNRGR